MVSLRQAVANNSPPDCCIEWFEPRLTQLTTKKEKPPNGDFSFFGAGDEARTRYLHLGKVALYRMSYTRNGQVVL